MQDKKVLDNSNSSNPWLINTNKNELIVRENIALSAEYIWSLQGNDREELVDWVYNFYKENLCYLFEEFCYESFLLEYEKFKLENSNKVFTNEGMIKNSSLTLLEHLRLFFAKEFYNSNRTNSNSIFDVLNSEKLFKKVLKNRMGYHISKEDGTERPMVFGITNKMIIQGIRSSGQGSIISQFKPLVAKFIYEKYCPKNGKVFDYSCGWGARMLAASSLNLEYYGIDPLTELKVSELQSIIKAKGKIFQGQSEEKSFYEKIPLVDFIFSSPPYFNMEIYSKETSQSYNRFPNYKDWLTEYWRETVKNCKSILNENGKFGVVIVENFDKKNIGYDMKNIILEEGFTHLESIPLITGNSHLTNKKQNGNFKLNDVLNVFCLT